MNYVCIYLKIAYKLRYINGEGYDFNKFKSFVVKDIAFTLFKNRASAEGAAYVNHDCCLNIKSTKNAFLSQPNHGIVGLCIVYRVKSNNPFTVGAYYKSLQVKTFVENFVKDQYSSNRKFKDKSVELTEKYKKGTMPKGYITLKDGDVIDENDLIYDKGTWTSPYHYHIGKPVKTYSIGFVGGDRDGQSDIMYDPLTIRKHIKKEHKFDIENPYLYKHEGDKATTWARLKQIADLGMEEVGVAQFGFEGVVSGLYIERIWDMSDGEWLEHVNWMMSLMEDKGLKHE